MKILYYDCFCGISGDMNIGALLDLGVEEAYLRTELKKLHVDEEYDLLIQKAEKKGISGTRVDVLLKTGEVEPVHAGHHHAHEAAAEPAHLHHHGHGQTVIKQGHVHRNLHDIEHIIEGSGLSDAVKRMSLDIFSKVAEAEAKVHGKRIEEVHFHEVGATDSIVDIVSAAICLDYLKVDRILASTVQLGSGFVTCAHGTIPVPAPATIEILKNVPIKTGLVPFETTTPTGAAILAAVVDAFTDVIDFPIERTGYGIGHRDLAVPNVLRVYLGDVSVLPEEDRQFILETNIDDMSPEFFTYVEECLLEKGALDVFRTPIVMKKGRLATKLSVLVDQQSEEAVTDILFKETTSLGLRKYAVEKVMLQRSFSQVSTPYGMVSVKQAFYKGEAIKYKPEYEDCRRLAKDNDLPLPDIYREITRSVEHEWKKENK